MRGGAGETASPAAQLARRASLRGALVALALASACTLQEGGPAPPAPPFALPDLAGRQVRLADFTGRTVVIDFWATWCEPCIHQIPVLNSFHRARAGDGVVVLGVSVDVGDKERVTLFSEEHGIEYPVLLGSESLAREYGVPGFPALAVVDPAGRIASVHLGVITADELERAVAKAAP